MDGWAERQRLATFRTRDAARYKRTQVSRSDTTAVAQMCSAMTTCSNGAPSRWNRSVTAASSPIASFRGDAPGLSLQAGHVSLEATSLRQRARRRLLAGPFVAYFDHGQAHYLEDS